MNSQLNLGPPTTTNPYLAELHGIAELKTVVNKPISSVLILAHEVRNPLTNINLAIAVLNRLITNEEERLYVEIIGRAAQRINNIVDEIVCDPLSSNMRVANFSFHELLNDALRLTEDRIMLKRIRVRKNYVNKDYHGILDRPKIAIALVNIIINAIEAMEEGKGELELITDYKGDRFELQIKDNGCGINAESLDQIFKPYYSHKPGGGGIGLTATLDILIANKVLISVNSKEGEGTRFVLSFASND
jgi:signal transduction histidine kinase